MNSYIKITISAILLATAVYSCDKYCQPDTYKPTESDPMSISIDEAESMLLEIMGKMENSPTKSAVDVGRTISDKYSISKGHIFTICIFFA